MSVAMTLDELRQGYVDALALAARCKRERNDYARQLADLRDERDTALAEAEDARGAKATMSIERENLEIRLAAALTELRALRGTVDGIHLELAGDYQGDALPGLDTL